MSTNEFVTNVLTQLILEYRPSFETLKKVLGMNEKDVCERIFTKNGLAKGALTYVLYHETKEEGLIDQDEAKRNIRRFLMQLHAAKTNKEKLELIKNLDSTSNIKKIETKTADKLTKEDIETIIKYRYKYTMTRGTITSKFDISEGVLKYRESVLDEDFKKKLKFLNHYNDVTYSLINNRRSK